MCIIPAIIKGPKNDNAENAVGDSHPEDKNKIRDVFVFEVKYNQIPHSFSLVFIENSKK